MFCPPRTLRLALPLLFPLKVIPCYCQHLRSRGSLSHGGTDIGGISTESLGTNLLRITLSITLLAFGWPKRDGFAAALPKHRGPLQPGVGPSDQRQGLEPWRAAGALHEQ